MGHVDSDMLVCLKDKAVEQAQIKLIKEVFSAFEEGAHTLVSTPVFTSRPHETIGQIAGEYVCMNTSELDEMLNIIGQAAKAPGHLGIRANGLISRIANAHAKLHGEAMAELSAKDWA